MLSLLTRLFVCGYVLSSLPAHSQNLSFNIQADAYSEPVSIKAFTDDWYGDFKGGEHAFAQGRAEWLLHQPQYELAAFWRYDYLLDFSESTAQLVHAYKNKLSPAAGLYPVAVDAHYSEAYGLRWQPLFRPQPHLTLGLGFNLLKGYKLTDGQVGGQVRLNGQGLDRHSVDNAALNIDYHYDEPQLYEDRLGWQPRNPSGEGFSLDLYGHWHSEQTSFQLQLYDVIGQLYWHDVPATQYQASYQTQPIDHSLTGQLAIDRRYRQRLPAHGFAELSQQWNTSWRSTLHILANQEMQLLTVSTGYRWQQWQTSLLAEPQTRALGLEIRHPNFYLRWLADDFNTNKAHRLGLSLGFNQSW